MGEQNFGMNCKSPLITVIIPTHHRPHLVGRALASALNQTYANLEVLVVIDGPEPGTADVLRRAADPRLRVIELEENVGISEVRNISAREAKGEWLSFLSDDDEWIPEKIAEQVEALAHSDPRTTLVACRYEIRSQSFSSIRPVKLIKDGEDLSEYLFCRSGYVSTGSMIRKDIVLKMPYRKGLQINEDNDWLLRTRAAQMLHISWAPRPLAIIHDDPDRLHLSKDTNWKTLLSWAQANRSYLTARSFSSVLLRHCLPLAANQRACKVDILRVVRLGCESAVPGRKDLLNLFIFTFLPYRVAALFRRETVLRRVCRRLSGSESFHPDRAVFL